MAMYGWTVDERVDMRRLRKIGVDGVVTNRPAMVVASLYTPRGVVA
jgi:glycerophosphoryl diester phosphodiesterase